MKRRPLFGRDGVDSRRIGQIDAIEPSPISAWRAATCIQPASSVLDLIHRDAGSPSHPSAEPTVLEVQAAARPLGQQVEPGRIASEHELGLAFATLAQQRVGGLLVMNAPVFFSNRERLAALAARHAIPTIYDRREFASAGGLSSYGASTRDQYRQSGVYTGRILKGAKPADLPVMQPTVFDLVVNLKAAKALGLKLPESFLLRADEVIE
jgi:putative ABC transport system substrate-binding protein